MADVDFKLSIKTVAETEMLIASVLMRPAGGLPETAQGQDGLLLPVASQQEPADGRFPVRVQGREPADQHERQSAAVDGRGG